MGFQQYTSIPVTNTSVTIVLSLCTHTPPTFSMLHEKNEKLLKLLVGNWPLVSGMVKGCNDWSHMFYTIIPKSPIIILTRHVLNKLLELLMPLDVRLATLELI